MTTYNTFDVYSWKTWFASLTLDDLYKLYGQWDRARQRTAIPHEREVLTWDMTQLMQEIVRREVEDELRKRGTDQG